MAEKVCERCGTAFTAGKGKHKWCEPCKWRVCEHCGEAFKVTPQHGAQRFCSHRCQADFKAAEALSRFWDNTRWNGECLEWTGPRNYAGYGVFYHEDKGKLAHRVAYELAHGSLSEDACVLHRCDSPPCIRPVHLFEGTREDNIFDMIGKGRSRHPVGEGHYRATLTEAEVRAIRAEHTARRSPRAIADERGLHRSTAQRIVARTAWRHVT